jgi:UDP-GlcNAc3NAcA epimerase
LIKIINLVGARSQIIKAAAVSRVLNNNFSDEITELIVYSGQHDEPGLNKLFFEQLALPEPTHHLAAPMLGQALQTGEMMVALENVLQGENPDVLLVYDDTNTTLAGALVAAKLQIPIAHIQAGLRSYNQSMPEEINRVITDRLSTFLFAPTEQAMRNLQKEGIENHSGNPSLLTPIVEMVGDVMIDGIRLFGEGAKLSKDIEVKLHQNKPILLLALQNNFDVHQPNVIREVLSAMQVLSQAYQVVFPAQPGMLKDMGPELAHSQIVVLPPISYFDMLALEQRAALIITNSAGVQVEAHYFQKPLVILRPETAWIDLVNTGVAKLCPLEKQAIIHAVNAFKDFSYPANSRLYGNGHAAEKICESILKALL